MNLHHRTIRGFSLLELMIVVAVIGVLAAVAYPAYTSSVLKGKRAQARTALVELLQQQERYLTQRNCYMGFTTDASGKSEASAPNPTTACGGITPGSVPFKNHSGDSPSAAAYLLSAENCSDGSTTVSIAVCVRVVATPTQADTDTEVGTLRMTSTGIKDCTPPKSGIQPPFTLCWP